MSSDESKFPGDSADVAALARSPSIPAPPTADTFSTVPVNTGVSSPVDADSGDMFGNGSDAVVGSSTDTRIVRELKRFSEADDDFWAFRGRAARQRTQGLTQYPAMMVPAMQAVLVKAVADVDGCVSRVFDPFTGSGTTLVECMRLGLDYTGQDINPLAVLFLPDESGAFPHPKTRKRHRGGPQAGGGGSQHKGRG